jgi:hypothetical protein
MAEAEEEAGIEREEPDAEPEAEDATAAEESSPGEE